METPLFQGKSRLVKYYNLARLFHDAWTMCFIHCCNHWTFVSQSRPGRCFFGIRGKHPAAGIGFPSAVVSWLVNEVTVQIVGSLPTSYLHNMDVSKNSGGFPPKSSISTGVSIINHRFWSTPIFGNTHMNMFFNLDFCFTLKASVDMNFHPLYPPWKINGWNIQITFFLIMELWKMFFIPNLHDYGSHVNLHGCSHIEIKIFVRDLQTWEFDQATLCICFLWLRNLDSKIHRDLSTWDLALCNISSWIFQIKYYTGILFTYPIPIKDDTQKSCFPAWERNCHKNQFAGRCFLPIIIGHNHRTNNLRSSALYPPWNQHVRPWKWMVGRCWKTIVSFWDGLFSGAIFFFWWF